jgi:hypothetical protein
LLINSWISTVFPTPCTTKETDFTTFCVRFDKVNYFDTCKQDLCCSTKVFEKPVAFCESGRPFAFETAGKPSNRVTGYIKKTSFNTFTEQASRLEHQYRLLPFREQDLLSGPLQ